MNYITETAKFTMKPKGKSNLKNMYEINVECDANDGDYMNTTVIQTCFSEKEILLLAYLNLNERFPWFSKWKDVKAIEDPNYAFGGKYIENNTRLDTDDFCLYDWVHDMEYLIYQCHSIEGFEITYYDENGWAFICQLPDLYELFDSEAEFINYVKGIEE